MWYSIYILHNSTKPFHLLLFLLFPSPVSTGTQLISETQSRYFQNLTFFFFPKVKLISKFDRIRRHESQVQVFLLSLHDIFLYYFYEEGISTCNISSGQSIHKVYEYATRLVNQWLQQLHRVKTKEHDGNQLKKSKQKLFSYSAGSTIHIAG